jgi:hypothetical protein
MLPLITLSATAAAAVLLPVTTNARDNDRDEYRHRDRDWNYSESRNRDRGSRHYYSGGYSYQLRSDVQRELRDRGFYRGPIDGVLGPRSREAIRRYQARHDLEETGEINTALLRSLGLD